MKRGKFLMMAAAVFSAVVAVSCAAVADVVVSPGNMNGWVVGTQSADGGSPIWRFTIGGAQPAISGNGAFYFFTDVLTGADPIEKIYLGTNNHSGVSVRDITSFKYYTYVKSRRYDGEGGWPDGQPPMIELITDSGTSSQQRRFVYKPWGWWGGHNVLKGEWQEWDLMAGDSAKWQMLGTDSTNCFGNWNWLINRYGSVASPMRLATPNVGDYRAGYDPSFKYSNQSGTSLSIKVGSGKAIDKMINQDTGVYETGKAWWRESCGIDAYADKLVIGINGVETVYDFEPDLLPVSPVGINPSSCRDKIIGLARDKCFFVVFGKVMDNPSGSEFFLDDGGGKKIKVIAPNGVEAGQYWRAKGYLRWDPNAARNDLVVVDPYGDGLRLLK